MVVPVDLISTFIVCDKARLDIMPDLDVAYEMHVLVGVAFLAELLLLAHALKLHWLLHS